MILIRAKKGLTERGSLWGWFSRGAKKKSSGKSWYYEKERNSLGAAIKGGGQGGVEKKIERSLCSNQEIKKRKPGKRRRNMLASLRRLTDSRKRHSEKGSTHPEKKGRPIGR